ncbi:septation protein SepH [Gordonia defluvii]|jgi:hypothetical protein|uniref:Septation protein SepH n=1 Tax=Gordonia defluvii TaxID=283718 RepID=A0ABP6L426_9ACTN|nr:septation protein SepH [Gordonia sp. UBA5067]
MRELRVTSVDADASYVICVDSNTGEKFRIPADDRLRAAARGDVTRLGQIQIEMESALRPREIQARIRAGASVDEVAAAAGTTVDRVQRFAHPVLLERGRATELIRAAHPMREDGPALATLDDVVATALRARGINPAVATWDAWKAEDGKWVGQLAWTAGHTENHAHWRYTAGSQGGTAEPLDNAADELVHPDAGARHQLQPVADPVESVTVNADTVIHAQQRTTEADPNQRTRSGAKPPSPAPPEVGAQPGPRRGRKQRKPEVPGWEEVLLGVRSTPNQ